MISLRCRCLFLALFCGLGVGATQAMAQNLEDGASFPESKRSTSANDLFPSAPAWLSRVYGSVGFETDVDPKLSVETVQPLWQSTDFAHTALTQARAAWVDGRWTLNWGAGYRFLTPDQNWILGANSFYDIQANDGHQRYGVGAEILQSYLTLRSNYYRGFSGWKTIEKTSSYKIQERALSGYDVSLETPVPYFPWLRFSTAYYTWDATTQSDVKGLQTKLGMTLSRNIEMDMGGSADNKDYALFANLRFSLGGPTASEETLLNRAVSSRAFEPRNMRRHTLDRIVRQNDIVTERRTLAVGEVSGVRVTIRRGS